MMVLLGHLGGSVNTNKYDVGHFGTQTAGISFGGTNPSGTC